MIIPQEYTVTLVDAFISTYFRFGSKILFRSIGGSLRFIDVPLLSKISRSYQS